MDIAMPQLIGYHFQGSQEEDTRNFLQTFIVGSNGVFIEAKRNLMYVRKRFSSLERSIPGLPEVEELFIFPKIPTTKLVAITKFFVARLPYEALAWLYPSESVFPGVLNWNVYIPKQNAGRGFVKPIDVDQEIYSKVLVEVHSHNTMDAFFSTTDDADETGLRIYMVIGKLNSPLDWFYRARVGIYGFFAPLELDDIFDTTNTDKGGITNAESAND